MFGAVHIGGPTTVPCGACNLLVPFATIPSITVNSGMASVGLRIPLDNNTYGITFGFQYLIAPTAAAACVGLPVGISNTLAATAGF